MDTAADVSYLADERDARRHKCRRRSCAFRPCRQSKSGVARGIVRARSCASLLVFHRPTNQPTNQTGQARDAGHHSPVKKDPSQAPVKVLAQTSNSLLQDIHLWRLWYPVGTLVIEVVLQDFVDRVDMGNWNQLLVLGDILPVVDEQRLDVIW